MAKELIEQFGGTIAKKEAAANFLVAVKGAGRKRVTDVPRGVVVVTLNWLQACARAGSQQRLPANTEIEELLGPPVHKDEDDDDEDTKVLLGSQGAETRLPRDTKMDDPSRKLIAKMLLDDIAPCACAPQRRAAAIPLQPLSQNTHMTSPSQRSLHRADGAAAAHVLEISPPKRSRDFVNPDDRPLRPPANSRQIHTTVAQKLFPKKVQEDKPTDVPAAQRPDPSVAGVAAKTNRVTLSPQPAGSQIKTEHGECSSVRCAPPR